MKRLVLVLLLLVATGCARKVETPSYEYVPSWAEINGYDPSMMYP